MRFMQWLHVAIFISFLHYYTAHSSSSGLTTSISSLLNKVSTEKLPIFEFAAQMAELIQSTENSQLDLDNLLSKYLSELRETYLNEFRKRIPRSGTKDDYAVHKDRILHECKTAMLAAIPPQSPPHWSIQSYVAELASDMNDLIEESAAAAASTAAASGDLSDMSLTGLSSTPTQFELFQQTVTYRRLRWVALQALLFGINYVQAEWARLVAKRAADRRLAEIPEFPLL